MLAIVLAALAATPAPRALPGADFVIHVPRLDQISGVVAFLEHAGEHSAMLRPGTWSEDLHPLIDLDLSRPESLSAAGIATSGWATASYLRDTRLTCTELADPQKFEAQADARLRTLGEPWTTTVRRAKVQGAKLNGLVRAGYVRLDDVACAVDGSDAEHLLREAAQWLQGRWPRGPSFSGLTGPVRLATQEGVVAFSGTKDRLEATGRIRRPDRSLVGAAQTALSGAPNGLLFLRSHHDPAELARRMFQVGDRLCRRCDARELGKLREALAAQLEGELLVRVDRFQPPAPLSTAAGRDSALKGAAVAPLKDADPVRRALHALETSPHARPTDEGVAFTIPGGEVTVEVTHGALVLSNDVAARHAALAVLGTPRRPTHAAELWIDPAALARALGRVSLVDVLASKQLMPVFAAAAETNPLLFASKSLHAWADPDGAQLRVGAIWELTSEGAR